MHQGVSNIKKEVPPKIPYNASRLKQHKKIEWVLPMTIIRQPSLFGIQELYEMEPTQSYELIISAIDLNVIHYEIQKESRLGAPVELDYPAMILTIFIRYVERIPTIKDPI